jgi:hypothetical protein
LGARSSEIRPAIAAVLVVSTLLVGCNDAQPTFGGAKAKAQRLVRSQFQLTHADFSHATRGRNPQVVCGRVSADGTHGHLEDVAYIANGDTDYAVLDDQTLSFQATPGAVANIGSADCTFPQLWKAMCRQRLPSELRAQVERCRR